MGQGYLRDFVRGRGKGDAVLAGWDQVVFLVERICGICSTSHPAASTVAMEDLGKIEAPERAQYIRVILAELQRLASHLVWLATHAVDIGAITPFFYTFRERDAILDLFEEYCGARLTLNTMKIGGVTWELPDGWVDRCSALVDGFNAHIDEYENLLTENRIWKQRTIGIGVVTAEEAIEWGLTGPPLRGSGVQWDIRKVFPYDRYDEIDFVAFADQVAIALCNARMHGELQQRANEAMGAGRADEALRWRRRTAEALGEPRSPSAEEPR